MKISFSFSLRILQVAVLVFGLTGLALAQSSSAEVNGVVKDTSGAVIPGATVRLIDIATNAETTTTANNGPSQRRQKNDPKKSIVQNKSDTCYSHAQMSFIDLLTKRSTESGIIQGG